MLSHLEAERAREQTKLYGVLEIVGVTIAWSLDCEVGMYLYPEFPFHSISVAFVVNARGLAFTRYLLRASYEDSAGLVKVMTAG